MKFLKRAVNSVIDKELKIQIAIERFDTKEVKQDYKSI